MDIDLYDKDAFFDGQPHNQFQWLREHDPVHWQDDHSGGGYWALVRYTDVKAVETDSETFSSEPNTLINDDSVIGDETHKHLIFSDPPHHTAHRKFLSPELSIRSVNDLRPHIEGVVTTIIDEVIEKGECDLVEDIAGRLASFVIADLLGLPREESLAMFDAASLLTRGLSTLEGEGLTAMTTIFEHGARAQAERKQHPRQDMLTRIAEGEVLGVPVDDFQFQMDFQLLVSAGSDTTRNVVSTGMAALFDHPDQLRALVEDPALTRVAIEEILRWDPPLVYQRRTATRDTAIGDQRIKAGQKVVSYYGAANRDPAVFADPETFDITRQPNPHLAFGAGRHFCLGSHLARLELITMFEAIVTRMPDIQPVGPTQWHTQLAPPSVLGPGSMPVRFTPGPRLESTGSAVLRPR